MKVSVQEVIFVTFIRFAQNKAEKKTCYGVYKLCGNILE